MASICCCGKSPSSRARMSATMARTSPCVHMRTPPFRSYYTMAGARHASITPEASQTVLPALDLRFMPDYPACRALSSGV